MKASSLPQSWADLSQPQLRYALTLMADGTEGADLWTLCLLRFASMTVKARNADGWTLRRHGHAFNATRYQLAEAAARLSWMDDLDTYDTRLLTAADGQLQAVDRALHGVAFGDWLKMEIAYQGTMQSRSDKPLRRLASLLYRAKDGHVNADARPSQAELLGAVLWYAAVKRRFMREFPKLFARRKSNADDTQNPQPIDMKQVVDTMIHTLTDGDVTKEPQVMQTDTWRCLAELERRIVNSE